MVYLLIAWGFSMAMLNNQMVTDISWGYHGIYLFPLHGNHYRCQAWLENQRNGGLVPAKSLNFRDVSATFDDTGESFFVGQFCRSFRCLDFDKSTFSFTICLLFIHRSSNCFTNQHMCPGQNLNIH